MTRINLIPVTALLDQHLMAEYRELPMVMGSLKRSIASPKWSDNKIPKQFTLNKGHVSFFYNKKKFLKRRYKTLIVELTNRGYNLDPNRVADFSVFDEVDCVDWKPDEDDIAVSIERILSRHEEKPEWYTLNGKRYRPRRYSEIVYGSLKQ